VVLDDLIPRITSHHRFRHRARQVVDAGTPVQRELLASLDLSMVREVEPVDLQAGRFQLSFEDDVTYGLKAADSKACARWCET
jgi:hypothetical protein